MRLGALIACFAVLVPVLARGQDEQPDTMVVPLSGIVVRALRGEDRLREIPATAFVVPRAELAASAASRLSTLLAALPGLYAYRSGGTGDPSVVDPRGFTASGESSYLKVLLNGRDTRDLENGNVDWDWLGPESADRLEVVEGAGAWLYGDGAAGGIVNVVRDEWRSGFRPRLTLRGGSFEQRGGSFGLAGGRGALAASLDGGGRESEGWRDRSHERTRSAHAMAGWRPGERTALSLDASWLRAYREDPGALTPQQIAEDRTQAETPWDFVNTEKLLAGVTLTHGESATQQWTLSPYARFEENEQRRTVFFIPYDHPTSGTTWGVDAGWRKTARIGWPAVLSLGYQLEQATLRSRYYDWNGFDRLGLLARAEAERLTQAASLGLRLDFSEHVVGRLGLRYDDIRVESEDKMSGVTQGPRTLDALSPLASLTVERGSIVTYASFSGAFHAPTLNQLYDVRPFLIPPGPVFTLSNGDLDPQRSLGYEVGIRWDDPTGRSGSLSWYDVWVKDEIDFDAATFSYANLGKSRHAGVLAASRLPMGGQVTFFTSGAWAPTWIRNGALDGNQINGVPLGTAYGKLSWSPWEWAALESGVRWVARQYMDKENEHPITDYTTVDLGLALRYGRSRVSVRAANLLDREYSDTGFLVLGEERFVPAAGRNVVVALTLE